MFMFMFMLLFALSLSSLLFSSLLTSMLLMLMLVLVFVKDAYCDEAEAVEEVVGLEGDTLMKTTGTFLFGQSNPKGSGRSAGPTRERTSPP